MNRTRNSRKQLRQAVDLAFETGWADELRLWSQYGISLAKAGDILAELGELGVLRVDGNSAEPEPNLTHDRAVRMLGGSR